MERPLQRIRDSFRYNSSETRVKDDILTRETTRNKNTCHCRPKADQRYIGSASFARSLLCYKERTVLDYYIGRQETAVTLNTWFIGEGTVIQLIAEFQARSSDRGSRCVQKNRLRLLEQDAPFPCLRGLIPPPASTQLLPSEPALRRRSYVQS